MPDVDRLIAFYRDVLGRGVLIDDELHRDRMSHFMRYPSGSRTRFVFMQGNHMFGKVALVHPLDQPFTDHVPWAVPGTVGHFAQSFVMPQLARARWRPHGSARPSIPRHGISPCPESAQPGLRWPAIRVAAPSSRSSSR